jgi:protein ImuB
MRLWIAVRLPLLALEVFRPRWCEPGTHAVLERERVLACTPPAAAAGVRVGMRRGGALALAPEVALHERNAGREQAALEEAALCLLQYTPEVALAAESSLLLEVGASLSAFGGRLALCRRVRASMQGLGFSVRLGMAPTGQGAWLLAAQTQGSRRRLRLAGMARRLDVLPCVLLPAARPHRDWLDGIGCRTLGQLRALPRAGLQRRCGPEVLEQLDRAYGTGPELYDWVRAPPRFAARLELPDRIEHAAAVLFGANRLILQMTGWLAARQLAVARCILWLEHERGRAAVPPTGLEIALAEAAWREEHLLRLLKERLGRTMLSAPVIALRLEAAQLEVMKPPSASLFPQPGGTSADYRRLLELLAARLGPESVLAPAPRADHRPEVGNQWAPAACQQRLAPPLAAGGERPFWLLEQPLELPVRDHRPFYGSPLQLMSGPERIECGWWDASCATRDYFVAEDVQAACYWVYRERGGEGARWFLHGLFG